MNFIGLLAILFGYDNFLTSNSTPTTTTSTTTPSPSNVQLDQIEQILASILSSSKSVAGSPTILRSPSKPSASILVPSGTSTSVQTFTYSSDDASNVDQKIEEALNEINSIKFQIL